MRCVIVVVVVFTLETVPISVLLYTVTPSVGTTPSIDAVDFPVVTG